MFVLPFVVARFTPADAGMAFGMMLFYAVNPIYSAILGIRAGKDIGSLWHLPLISAAMFLLGAWLAFHTVDFSLGWYSLVYGGIGTVSMLVSHRHPSMP